MSTASLQANARTALGKGSARKLRASGQIPAIIYRGGGAPLNISVDPGLLTAHFRKAGTDNTLVDIEFNGVSHSCIVKESQRHPVSRELIHVDFFEVDPNKEIQFKVEIVLKGKAKGMEVGGKCEQFMRFARLAGLPRYMPARWEVDISPLELNEFFRLSKLTPPEGCRAIFKSDANVVGILGTRKSGEEAAGA